MKGLKKSLNNKKELTLHCPVCQNEVLKNLEAESEITHNSDKTSIIKLFKYLDIRKKLNR